MRPLPPYGQRFLHARQSAGPWIAVGSEAWAFPMYKSFPVMVLPPDANPFDFDWPVRGQSVLVHQWGAARPDTLDRLMLALFQAGAEMIVAVGLPQGALYAYREVHDVAA